MDRFFSPIRPLLVYSGLGANPLALYQPLGGAAGPPSVLILGPRAPLYSKIPYHPQPVDNAYIAAGLSTTKKATEWKFHEIESSLRPF